MDRFDLIDVLKNYANNAGMLFAIGDYPMLNYEIGQINFKNGQLFLGVDMTKVTPELNEFGRVQNVVFEGFMLLGQKVDCDGTVSTITETQLQKYERRGKMLLETITAILPMNLCSGGWEVNRFEIEPKINQFDTGIDFVIADFRVSK